MEFSSTGNPENSEVRERDLVAVEVNDLLTNPGHFVGNEEVYH